MKRGRVLSFLVAAGMALTSVVAMPGVAFADESQTGYRDCAAGQRVRIDVYGLGTVTAYWTTGPDHLGGHSGQITDYSAEFFSAAVSITAPYSSVQWRATAAGLYDAVNPARLTHVDVLCV